MFSKSDLVLLEDDRQEFLNNRITKIPKVALSNFTLSKNIIKNALDCFAEMHCPSRYSYGGYAPIGTEGYTTYALYRSIYDIIYMFEINEQIVSRYAIITEEILQCP